LDRATVVHPAVVLDCRCASNPDDGSSWYRGRAGTPGYFHPEMLRRDAAGRRLVYGMDCDWWAFGCLLYALMTGSSPFTGPHGGGDDALTLAGRIDWPAGVPFSRDAKDLLSRLLHPDPARRLGAGPFGWRAVMAHPFFARVDWGLLEAKVLPAPAAAVPPYMMPSDEAVTPAKVRGEHTAAAAVVGAARRASAEAAAAAVQLSEEDEAAFAAMTYTAPSTLLRGLVKAALGM